MPSRSLAGSKLLSRSIELELSRINHATRTFLYSLYMFKALKSVPQFLLNVHELENVLSVTENGVLI